MRKNVELILKRECTGCMMCGDICPKQAISFSINVEDGFWYPVIDRQKCIGCELCYQKCPTTMNMVAEEETTIVCYGGKSKNENIRAESTSGGVFSELAYRWIDMGGVCAGAEYNLEQQVVHRIENNKEGIIRLRQSKYVQSDAAGIYTDTRNALIDGTQVMFCGTPCQVAALKSFLGKSYENLVTLDFVCCGICSPEVYRQYLNSLKQKYKSSITRVWFKNKEFGWRQLGTRIDFSNGKKYFKAGSSDPYMVAFVADALSMRESCEHCRYRKVPHISDITLADFWGIEKIKPEIDDNKGLSAVMVNSERGKKLFDSISEKLDFFETSVQDIAAGNFTVYKAKKASLNRDDFLKECIKYGFNSAIDKYSSYSGMNKLRSNLNFYKIRVKTWINGKIRRR